MGDTCSCVPYKPKFPALPAHATALPARPKVPQVSFHRTRIAGRAGGCAGRLLPHMALHDARVTCMQCTGAGHCMHRSPLVVVVVVVYGGGGMPTHDVHQIKSRCHDAHQIKCCHTRPSASHECALLYIMPQHKPHASRMPRRASRVASHAEQKFAGDQCPAITATHAGHHKARGLTERSDPRSSTRITHATTRVRTKKMQPSQLIHNSSTGPAAEYTVDPRTGTASAPRGGRTPRRSTI